MATIPIKLIGDNLGKRHQYLNSLVNDAYKNKVSFESVRELPEMSPVDRLFKIDLASKYKNIDFIVHCLKDQDMLYVSRALKCFWILENSDLISPQYLEETLYPEMTLVAINKMRNWIALHLKDTEKCEQFYEYYRQRNNTYALKFYPKCFTTYIVDNLDGIPFSKITPRFAKLLCEKTSAAAEKLYKILKDKDIELRDGNYKKKKESFMANLQIMLKRDPEQFFYLIENFYEPRFKRLNKRTTKYIMRNHKDRFEAKSELYASTFLDLSMVATFLSNDEIKTLVTKLAKAAFLKNFSCNYKFAEPLVKRLEKSQKTEYCKKIFENKDYGEIVETPPYYIPAAKERPSSFYPVRYDHNLSTACNYRCMLKKRSCREAAGCWFQMESKLDKLFNQYRFIGFEKCFHDFKKLLPKESDLENRQNIFLVLISKTGGKAQHLSSLLEFLIEKHANEPSSLRATVVRSLMKRACAWRMPANDWDLLKKFSHDLGLDGSDSVVPCIEGLHGVVLHEILQSNSPPQNILAVFLRGFSTLSDYPLSSEEKKTVVPNLITVLLYDAYNTVLTGGKENLAAKRLEQILDTIDAYKQHLKQYPEVISTIKDLISPNPAAYRELLDRVFKLNVARQTFFKENFKLRQTDESYLNALKVNTEVLRNNEQFKDLLDKDGAKHLQRFARKLVVYFGEEKGLLSFYQAAIKSKIEASEPNPNLAKMMVLLCGSAGRAQEFLSLLESPDTRTQKGFVAALWNNVHLARPRPLLHFEESRVNMIATANYLQTCKPVTLQEKLPFILLEPRFARQLLALRASDTKGLIAATLPQAARSRHILALQVALRLLRRHLHTYQEQDWNAFTNLVRSKALVKKNTKVYHNFAKIDGIPEDYKMKYALVMYEAFARAKLGSEHGPSYSMTMAILLYINDNMAKADSVDIEHIIIDFLENNCSITKLNSSNYEYNRYFETFVQITLKFILLNTGDNQKSKIKNILNTFLKKIKEGWNGSEELVYCVNSFVEPLSDLKQNRHYEDDELMNTLLGFYNEVLPLDENFENNMKMRFTMLLNRALKMCRNQDIILKDQSLESPSFIKALGIAYARMLADDLNLMIDKYFESIVGLYSESLRSYLYNLRSQWSSSSWDYFKVDLLRTLLEEQSTYVGRLLGALLYCTMEYEFRDDNLKEFVTKIEDERIKFLVQQFQKMDVRH